MEYLAAITSISKELEIAKKFLGSELTRVGAT